MSLWGATDADESKPKNLTTAEKKEVFANASGWVREAVLYFQVTVIQVRVPKC